MDSAALHRDTAVMFTTMLSRVGLLLGLVLLAALGSCTSPPESMMDTPAIWRDGQVDPFAQLDDARRVNALPVNYATRRRPRHLGETDYGTDVDPLLHLGTTDVLFGDDLSWTELAAISRSGLRPSPVNLDVVHSDERGSYVVTDPDLAPQDHSGFFEGLEAQLAESTRADLLIYVHGAKVDFYRCVARTGEVIHFAGRDVVPLVFDWPTHTSLWSYVFGEDVQRAHDAGADLALLIELLAESTSARRIHVLSYSAGAKVLAKALTTLAEHRPEDPAALRLGTVVFAAGDLERSEFLADLPQMHRLVERLTVTMSDDDGALHAAQLFMGGEVRLGEDPGDALSFAHELTAYEKLEIVDVSWGQSERGFDIGTHHYWHHHPWVTSDLILNLRGGAPAEQRGLVEVEAPLWAFPPDYPERAAQAARRLAAP